jgi:hypothetical protein
MKLITFICAAMAFGSLASRAFADRPSRQYEVAAKKLTDILIERECETVSIGPFSGDQEINRGVPGIRLAFTEAFQQVNQQRRATDDPIITVSSNSNRRIEGLIEIEDDPHDLGSPEESRFLVVKITLTLFDGENQIYPLSFYLDRIRDVVQTAGLPIAIESEDARRSHRQIRLVRHQVNERKNVFVRAQGSRIKNTDRSPYAIELLTKSPLSDKYTPRPPLADESSVPQVPIGIGEQYAVKFYNDSDREVAIALQIDGIDQFQFSEDRNPKTGRPIYSTWIVGPHKHFAIKGWHITAKKSDRNLSSFVVTKYGEGAAQHVIRPDDSQDGVITLSVSHSHIVGSGGSKASAQTGFGPPIAQNQSPTKRKIDPPHEFFAVRYSR